MTTRDNGGPAFPVSLPNVGRGMTLRDWFAGQALVGIFANPDISATAARLGASAIEFRDDTARAAFAAADTMLAAREQKPNDQ